MCAIIVLAKTASGDTLCAHVTEELPSDIDTNSGRRIVPEFFRAVPRIFAYDEVA